MTSESQHWDVAIIGGGLAGTSAAIYLGRAMRRVVVIDSGRSLARWEPDVQNYLGFPEGVSGEELLKLGQIQAESYDAEYIEDEIIEASGEVGHFRLRGQNGAYHADRVLIATGIFHLPPEIPGFNDCIGESMFFCKDCDGYRIQGQPTAVVGTSNEAVEYALNMLLYSPCVSIATNGKKPAWDKARAEWISEYRIPVYTDRIVDCEVDDTRLRRLILENGTSVQVEALFTTRGDVFHNKLAKSLGAKIGPEGEVMIDNECRTTVPGVYAAGCVTPANCQMIIAAGQGAAAAQTINRELFTESLKNHQLRRFREQQIDCEETEPVEHHHH